MHLFCHPPATNGLDAKLRGLAGMAAANVGIGDDLLSLITCFESPRDFPTAFQEQGRGSRQEGSPSKHILMHCLPSFDYTIHGYLVLSTAITTPGTQAKRQLEFVVAMSVIFLDANSA